MFADDPMTMAEGAGPEWFGGAEDGDGRHAQHRGEVHGAGVIGDERIAGLQFFDQLRNGSLADSILARALDLRSQRFADWSLG